MKIGQKTSQVKDKLLEIENFHKPDKYTTKLMAASRKVYVIVLVYWFDLWHITLGRKSNSDVYNSGKCGLWFSTRTRPPSRVKPRCFKKKNSKYKLKMTMSKRMGGMKLMTCFKQYQQVFHAVPNTNST